MERKMETKKLISGLLVSGALVLSIQTSWSMPADGEGAEEPAPVTREQIHGRLTNSMHDVLSDPLRQLLQLNKDDADKSVTVDGYVQRVVDDLVSIAVPVVKECSAHLCEVGRSFIGDDEVLSNELLDRTGTHLRLKADCFHHAFIGGDLALLQFIAPKNSEGAEIAKTWMQQQKDSGSFKDYQCDIVCGTLTGFFAGELSDLTPAFSAFKAPKETAPRARAHVFFYALDAQKLDLAKGVCLLPGVNARMRAVNEMESEMIQLNQAALQNQVSGLTGSSLVKARQDLTQEFNAFVTAFKSFSTAQTPDNFSVLLEKYGTIKGYYSPVSEPEE
jgi:hypothetical protein